MNNKGFMLLEVVIVSTIVLTTFTIMFKEITKINIGYTRLATYHNTDAIYAGRDVYNALIDKLTIDDLLKKTNCILIGDKALHYNINDEYRNIKGSYKVENMYYVPAGKLKDTCLENFTDEKYMTYLQKRESKIDVEEEVTEHNLIVTEIKDDKNNYYYGYFEVR